MQPTRVLIADDERLFVDALELILAADARIEVVGRALDGYQAIALARELNPDVVLIDLSMPGIDGFGAIAVGVIASTIVWMAIRFLSRAPVFRHVDHTLGVIYTHAIAGLCGGLMVGLFADPSLVEYIGVHGASNLPGKASVFNGGSWTLLRWQAEAALWVIVFSGVVTFVLLNFLADSLYGVLNPRVRA